MVCGNKFLSFGILIFSGRIKSLAIKKQHVENYNNDLEIVSLRVTFLRPLLLQFVNKISKISKIKTCWSTLATAENFNQQTDSRRLN